MREPTPSLDIRDLLDPAAYPHPVDRVELMETHLSWLLLAGELVYKINRPVRLGFVDFSSPEQREASCREGLRLNRRLAPQLYLGVVSVTLEADGRPRLEGAGPILEYALKMRRFPEAALLSRALPEGRLRPEHIDRLAERIADFHQAAEPAPAQSRFGSPEALRRALRECLDSLAGGGPDGAQAELVHELDAWCERRIDHQAELIRQRQADGFVRECHGDLHLGNMFLEDEQVTVFDCIDFDPALRWIDVMTDLAFCVMDLRARERADLGSRFLDGYLQHSGDYRGLRILRLGLVYRALVRAKVARLRRDQVQGAAAESCAAELRRYLELAADCTRPGEPRLLITHGVSGSGKSRLTRRLPEAIGALRLRSDIERRRLPDAPRSERYTPSARARVYARLLVLAEEVLRAGHPVVVDATFLDRQQREAFHELADKLAVPFTILAFDAPEAVLRQRITARAATGGDPSEADLAVLTAQLQQRDPLAPAERPHAIVIDSAAADAEKRLIQTLAPA